MRKFKEFSAALFPELQFQQRTDSYMILSEIGARHQHCVLVNVGEFSNGSEERVKCGSTARHLMLGRSGSQNLTETF